MTLPTTKDSDIDWAKCLDNLLNNEVPQEDAENIIADMRQAAAQERERCARCLVETFPNQYGLDAAAAIIGARTSGD